MNKNYLTWDNIDSLLLSTKKILNVKELASFTGMSTSWIYKLCQQGKIPHSKPNNKLIFFDRAKVDDWLLSNPVALIDDVEQEAINYVANKPWRGDYGTAK